MLSPGLIARVSRARRSIERLKRLASMPWSDYSSDEDAQALAERHLHILLECILDLAAFITARKGVSRGPTYRDVMEAIISSGAIPRDLVEVARAVPGMRNVLVHGYADVRHDILYQVLREDLPKLERILYELMREAERLDP